MVAVLRGGRGECPFLSASLGRGKSRYRHGVCRHRVSALNPGFRVSPESGEGYLVGCGWLALVRDTS